VELAKAAQVELHQRLDPPLLECHTKSLEAEEITLVARETELARLNERLNLALVGKGGVVFVTGEAGSGKTALLSKFTTELRQPVAWVSLDEADNNPIRFWTYLITACQSVRCEIGQAALALLQTPQPFSDDRIPTILINDIDRSEADLVLVLDDYHTIQNHASRSAFSFLLDHLPIIYIL
jgi:LuxR family transcriptional regulator, maltose regulon positive regulatory protein